MVNKLSREFAAKTEQERKAMFAGLQFSPVLHTDCTNAKENGKNVSVFVRAIPDGKAMYFARRKKGMKECLAHVLRYLKDGIENEADRTWNKEMRSLIQEMLHYRNGLSGEAVPDTEKVNGFEECYRAILQKAKEEYDYIPASAYYKEGYNLYLRMEEYIQIFR